MGLVKTRRLAYPPLAGADDSWGSRQAERCECRAMQKQQRAKAGMKPPVGNGGGISAMPTKLTRGV
jgi:hypothetical protein